MVLTASFIWNAIIETGIFLSTHFFFGCTNLTFETLRAKTWVPYEYEITSCNNLRLSFKNIFVWFFIPQRRNYWKTSKSILISDCKAWNLNNFEIFDSIGISQKMAIIKTKLMLPKLAMQLNPDTKIYQTAIAQHVGLKIATLSDGIFVRLGLLKRPQVVVYYVVNVQSHNNSTNETIYQRLISYSCYFTKIAWFFLSNFKLCWKLYYLYHESGVFRKFMYDSMQYWQYGHGIVNCTQGERSLLSS